MAWWAHHIGEVIVNVLHIYPLQISVYDRKAGDLPARLGDDHLGPQLEEFLPEIRGLQGAHNLGTQI